jgi:FKBP-type peptidyl-prolyl cis-trans isomerase
MKYVGKLADGTKFDSAAHFKFTLGAGEVIKGWDAGVLGMQVGEEAALVVPPSLGYGKRGAPPEIPGDATLHFTVVLNRIL